MKSDNFISKFVNGILLTTITALIFSAPSFAQQQWWFDVEVIVFKRLESAEALVENFKIWENIDTSTATDLLTPYLYPDISLVRDNLPVCYPAQEPLPSFDALQKALIELEKNNVDAEALTQTQPALSKNEPSTDTTDDLFQQLEQDKQEFTDNVQFTKKS